MGDAPDFKTVSLAELNEHNTVRDLWTAVHGQVYDLTSFATDHPGGVDVLADCAGIDGSEAYDYAGHSADNKKTLQRFVVGRLPGYTDDRADVDGSQATSTTKESTGGTGPWWKVMKAKIQLPRLSSRSLLGLLFGAITLLCWRSSGLGGDNWYHIKLDGVENVNRVTAFLGGLFLASLVTGAALVFVYHEFCKTLEHTKEVFAYPAVIPKKV